ncbi:MAG: glycosyltransferase family 1 protein [Solirubrobacterales bacterium]|nr:glycosyltransferase family 1 protein [Solirubrobacterales bacterium]
MRILTIGNMYPPHQLGGAELVWQSWVQHARSLGHEVKVLTTDVELAGSAVTAATEQGVERSLRWYWRDHEFPRLGARARWAIERHNRRVLTRSLDEVDPDVVVWWAMAGMSFSLIEHVRRRPLASVAVLGDYWLQYGPDVDGWMRAFATRPRLGRVVERLTGLPTQVQLEGDMSYVFISETLRTRALEAFPGLSGTEVANHGPDLDLFRPAERPPWSWRLLYLGRIDERKGVAIAIRALRHLPEEATLRIVGSGDDAHLESLRRLAREERLTERVFFTERRPRAELPALLAAADALVFPVTWAEPWGLVPSEAMAVGTPVVGSGRGGSGEYMRDGENSLIFEPDEGPEALAARLRTMAEDPALRERLRKGGLKTVADLCTESFDDRVQAAVQRAARDPGAGPQP